MMEIVRGRSWKQEFTILDNEDGPLTDLSVYDTFQCQIREKDAIKNKITDTFENALVQEVTVNVDTGEAIITLSLTGDQTKVLKNGIYQIDIIGLFEGGEEALLDPEPVSVNNRPTIPA